MYDIKKLEIKTMPDGTQFLYKIEDAEISFVYNKEVDFYSVMKKGDDDSEKTFPFTKDGFEDAVEYFELLVYKEEVPKEEQRENPNETELPPIGRIIIRDVSVQLELPNIPIAFFKDDQYEIKDNIFTALKSSDGINMYDKFYIDIRSKRTDKSLEEYNVYPVGDAELNDSPKQKIDKETIREIQKQEKKEDAAEESDGEPNPIPNPKPNDTESVEEPNEFDDETEEELEESDNTDKIKEILCDFYRVSDYNKLLNLFNGKEGLLDDIKNNLDEIEEAKMKKDLSPYLDVNKPLATQLNNIL
jgi:hypothetical protein